MWPSESVRAERRAALSTSEQAARALRSIAGAMPGDQIGQADRFVTEFFSDQSISARSLVALIKSK